MTRTVIVGSGMAAHHLASRVRDLDPGHDVLVLGTGSEPGARRGMLTSVFTSRLTSRDCLLPPIRDGGPGVGPVDCIDIARREVRTSDGRRHRFEFLVLATGARPRIPRIPGIGQPGRTAIGVVPATSPTHLDRLPGPPYVMVGGGPMAVLMASHLGAGGQPVTLLHRGGRLLEHLLPPRASRIVAEHLERSGVTLALGTVVKSYEAGRARLDDGVVIECGSLVLCTGLDPDTRIARQAGMGCANGIVVDDQHATDVPGVFALGDCVHPRVTWTSEERLKVEADHLAHRLTGRDAPQRSGPDTLRLHLPGLDVAIASDRTGECACPARTFEVSGPDSACFLSITSRHGRPSAACCIGLPRVTATLEGVLDGSEIAEQLASYAALDIGAESDGSNSLVCVCNNVTRGEIHQALTNGATSVSEVAMRTSATTGCGSCTDSVSRLLGDAEAT